MVYLLFTGLILALMVNHAVYLFARGVSIVTRIAIATSVVLLTCIAALWFLGRILSHRVMDFESWTAWLAVSSFALASTWVLQRLYAKSSG
jgi:hypothetical protein